MHKLHPLAVYAEAIADWASFEREVDSTLWEAIGSGPVIGACITDQIQSVRSKLIITEDILAEAGVNDKQLKRLRSFRNSVESLTRERNRIVHDPHWINEKKFVVSRSRKDNAEDVDIVKFTEFSQLCYEKAMELRDLFAELHLLMRGNHGAVSSGESR